MPIKIMKTLSRNILVSIGFVALLIIISGCSFLPTEETVLAPPLAEPPQIEYQMVEVIKGDIVSSISGVGALTPKNYIDLHYTENGGRIEEVHVSQGDWIEKGQVLAELETGNLKFDIQQLELDVEKSRLRLAQTRENNQDWRTIRIEELNHEGIQNRLKLLKAQLSEARIIAPIDGIVTFTTDLESGDHIGAYESIIQVAETSELQIQYQAPNAVNLNPVSLGMEAIIKLDDPESDGVIEVMAEVVQIPTSVPTDVSSKNPEYYKGLVVLNTDDLPEAVGIGDRVDFEIILAQKEDTLIIPKTALRTFSGRNYVQMMIDGSRREIDIQTGVENSRQIEVLEGIDEGDKLIVR